jgi:hypothetical protein
VRTESQVLSSPAAAEIHTWTDAGGVRHFTNAEAQGQALPEIPFDAETHRKRLAAEARAREIEAAIEASRPKIIRVIEPSPPPAPHVIIQETTVEAPVQPYSYYRRPVCRTPWRPVRPVLRPRPGKEHVPYYLRHLPVHPYTQLTGKKQ